MPSRKPSDLAVAIRFLAIRDLVAGRVPALWGTKINTRCHRIARDRRTSKRAYMHVGCAPGTICTWAPAAALLPDPILCGILLHEFGHLAGGDEGGADRWVYQTLGMPVRYATRLHLECVDPVVLNRKLAELRK